MGIEELLKIRSYLLKDICRNKISCTICLRLKKYIAITQTCRKIIPVMKISVKKVAK
jgi:hypothetical protein